MSFLPLFGSKKKKINCKFCGKNTDYLKVYNDFFCSNCNRFQSEDKVDEVKNLQIFRLKKYNFTAQKYSYFIYNELGSKIAFIERRDISKYTSDKEFNLRYLVFNDVNRIIASIDGKKVNSQKNSDGTWLVYDYGRNLRGKIQFVAEEDIWKIFDANDKLIGIRKRDDNKSLSKSMRQYILLDPDNPDNRLFKVNRKGGFELTFIDNYFDPYLGWAFVIALHRKFYA